MYPEVREELSKRVTLLASSTFVYVGSEVQTQVVRIVQQVQVVRIVQQVPLPGESSLGPCRFIFDCEPSL